MPHPTITTYRGYKGVDSVDSMERDLDRNSCNVRTWSDLYDVLVVLVTLPLPLRLRSFISIDSYGAVVEAQFGRPGALSTQISIIVNNFGIMVVYLIIIADVLVGTTTHPGVIPETASLDPTALPWYTTRPFIIITIAVTCLAPLLALRSMTRLATASVLSICIAALFALSVLVLAFLSVAADGGPRADLHFLPDPQVELEFCGVT